MAQIQTGTPSPAGYLVRRIYLFIFLFTNRVIGICATRRVRARLIVKDLHVGWHGLMKSCVVRKCSVDLLQDLLQDRAPRALEHLGRRAFPVPFSAEVSTDNGIVLVLTGSRLNDILFPTFFFVAATTRTYKEKHTPPPPLLLYWIHILPPLRLWCSHRLSNLPNPNSPNGLSAFSSRRQRGEIL
jgi:hypothetical protein